MSATLQEQADEIKEASAGQLPPEAAKVFGADQQAMAERGAPDAIKVGTELSDFTLTDATGNEVSLSSLTGDGPAVLTWYRGAWCPFCNMALHTYQEELVPRLSEFGATMAAITPQTPDASLTTVEKHGLSFPVLTDVGSKVAREVGIAFQPPADVLGAQQALGLDIREGNADSSPEIPMPAVLVVDRERIVRFVDVQADYTRRTEVADIVAALQAL